MGSVSLLAELALRAPPEKVEEGKEPPPDPRELLGHSAVELLRRKVRGVSSISAGAAALQQVMSVPDQINPIAVLAPQVPATSTTHSTFDDADDSLDDTDHQRQLEV